MKTRDYIGSSHLIECTGKKQNGEGYVAWIPTWLPKKYPNDSLIVLFCVASVQPLRFWSFVRSNPKTPSNSQLLVNIPAYTTLILTSSMEGTIMSEYSEWKKQTRMSTKKLFMLLLNFKFQKHILIFHRVPSKNLKKDGAPYHCEIRSQTNRIWADGEKKLKDCEEKIYINDDITLLRARLATSSSRPSMMINVKFKNKQRLSE